MLDHTIDEMEKDPDYRQANWDGGEDTKSSYEAFDHGKNKKILNDYTTPMLQKYARPFGNELDNMPVNP